MIFITHKQARDLAFLSGIIVGGWLEVYVHEVLKSGTQVLHVRTVNDEIYELRPRASMKRIKP